MKTLLHCLFVTVALAQTPQPKQPSQTKPQPQPQVGRGRGGQTQHGPIQATPQQAQTVTISLSADLVTALESLRLNTLGQGGTPAYPDVASLVQAMVGQQFRQVVRQFPSAALKAKRDAAIKAQADADAAEATIVTGK